MAPYRVGGMRDTDCTPQGKLAWPVLTVATRVGCRIWTGADLLPWTRTPVASGRRKDSYGWSSTRGIGRWCLAWTGLTHKTLGAYEYRITELRLRVAASGAHILQTGGSEASWSFECPDWVGETLRSLAPLFPTLDWRSIAMVQQSWYEVCGACRRERRSYRAAEASTDHGRTESRKR